ncbi:MAG: sigma-70 family RNA polymerase sigma factor [Candidatus Acidiferrum sp.]
MINDVVEGFAERGIGERDSQTGKLGFGARAGEPGVKCQDVCAQSFDEIFLAHYARVVGVLRRMVGDHGRAEDLASEVFLKFYRQDTANAAAGNVSGWLYRTATNLGIDALRAANRRGRLEQAAAKEVSFARVAESAFDQMARAETQHRVRMVLAELKPPQAQLLLLRTAGHSYKELAAALEMDAGSVGTSLIRAEAAFARRYRELYGEEDV